MKIPKYQTGTPNGGVRDNTNVVNPHMLILPLMLFPKLQPTQFYGDPRQPQLKSETRTPRELEINNQEGRKKAETQLWLKQREKNAEAFDNLMRLTMPSTYVGQIMGLQLTGLPALAVDLAFAPIAGAIRTVGRKGLQSAARNLPKVSLGRNTSGEWNGWINVGNYQYRPSRNTLGMNFPSVERRPIIHQARGKFNPILESDIPELENMLNAGLYREMTIPGTTQKVKMYFPSGNKQPIREDELLLLLSRYLPKRELSELEREFAKQAPQIIKELKKKYGNELDFSEWFTGRPQLGSNAPGAVTQLDVDIFNSHIPEYAKLAESLQKDGMLVHNNNGWFGRFSDKTIKVDPKEYIVANSKTFKTNWRWDGSNYLSGMTAEQYNKLLNNGGLGAENWVTTNGEYAGKIASETVGGRTVGSLVGRNNHEENILSSPLKNPTSSSYFGAGKSVNNGVSSKGTTYIPIINDGKSSSWKVFGEDVQVKALRGNNGDFSI